MLGLGDVHAAASNRTQTENRFGELALAVARHPGNTDNFTGVHTDRQVLDREVAAVANDIEVVDGQLGFSDLLRRHVSSQFDRTADHQLGELLTR